jgi:acyl carrier protein
MTNFVEKSIVEIISDVSGLDPEEIAMNSNFFKDLEIDSIKAIEITVAIEKKFKISVRDEDVPKLTTVRQAVELVGKLVSLKSSESTIA